MKLVYLTEIYKFLNDSKTSLSVNESCTGGYLSYLLTSYPGISKVYKGALVSYQTEIKESLAEIPKEQIEKYGLVSHEIVLLMAKSAIRLFHSDWAIATSGYAGPKTESDKLPVGSICFAIVGPKFERVEMKMFKDKTREKIQQSASKYALKFFCESLYNSILNKEK